MTRTLPPRPARLTPLGQTDQRALDRLPAAQARPKTTTFNSAV